MYFFDEYDEFYRYPNGAVEAGAVLRLRVKYKCGLCAGVKVLYNPDNGETREALMRFVHVRGSYDVFETEIKFDSPDLYWYNFQLITYNGGLSYINANGIEDNRGPGFQVTVYDNAGPVPDWVRGGVIYHIFVDRFRRGDSPAKVRAGAVFRDDWGGCPAFLPDSEGIVRNNDFFGGDFDGIIEKLPYLEELGVNCIYLSPVFDAASNHKYDTGDFFRIDESFGGDEAFARLIAKAGERGIKIILDGVFSHVGVDSVYFNKYGNHNSVGAYQDIHSPYFDWFTFYEWNSVYESWWGIDLLPALDKRNESYRNFICGENGVIAYWTKKGVAGWRLDVADELPDVFLYPLCAAIKREKSDALIIGEVWEDASNKISYGVRRRYLLGGQLDGVMNYPLKDAIINMLKTRESSTLAAVMASLSRNYPEKALHSMMNVLGTHDTARVLTVLGADALPGDKTDMSRFSLSSGQRECGKRLLKIAALLQYTLPGIPCVYYGDEAGMEGCADPFNRRCYPWGAEDGNLVAWYKMLGRLRRDCPCLKDGKYELVTARGGIFEFTRGEGAEKALVAVNLSGGDRIVDYGGYNYEMTENKRVDSCVVKSGGAAVFTVLDKCRPRPEHGVYIDSF